MVGVCVQIPMGADGPMGTYQPNSVFPIANPYGLDIMKLKRLPYPRYTSPSYRVLEMMSWSWRIFTLRNYWGAGGFWRRY